MADASYKFLWPFLAVLVICLSVMVVFVVSYLLLCSFLVRISTY